MKQNTKRRSLFGKKGNAILDTIIFIVVFTVIALSWVTSGMLSKSITEDIEQNPDMFSNRSMEIITKNNDRFPILFDNLFVFAFGLFWILVLVASYNIETLPIFFVMSLILLIFVFIFAASMGNMWEEVMEEDEYAEVIVDMPKMDFIMSHLLQVSIMVGFSILFILYAKGRQ